MMLNEERCDCCHQAGKVKRVLTGTFCKACVFYAAGQMAEEPEILVISGARDHSFNGTYYASTEMPSLNRITDCFADATYFNSYSDFGDEAASPAEMSRRWWKHLAEFEVWDMEPNPLPILMRAVNSVRMRLPIRQPCWRAARWRSLT